MADTIPAELGALKRRAIIVSQNDSDSRTVGPVIQRPPSTFYDATSHTAEMLVKATSRSDDTSATTITGTPSGDTDVGFSFVFDIPFTLTGAPGRFWYHVRLLEPGGDAHTIAKGPFIVEEA